MRITTCKSIKDDPYTICEKMKGQGIDRVTLSFSAGKDSIAAWIALRQAGIKVDAFYLSMFPMDLRIVRESLEYYEDKFGERITVFPHPYCYGILVNLLFMGPAQVRMMEIYEISKIHSMQWVDKKARELMGNAWAVKGIKMADSFNRACVLKKTGDIDTATNTAYPMKNVGDRYVYSMLTANKIALPDIYRYTGESFDSLRKPTMDYIREKYPDDWTLIKTLQPLIELEYARLRLTHNG